MEKSFPYPLFMNIMSRPRITRIVIKLYRPKLKTMTFLILFWTYGTFLLCMRFIPLLKFFPFIKLNSVIYKKKKLFFNKIKLWSKNKFSVLQYVFGVFVCIWNLIMIIMICLSSFFTLNFSVFFSCILMLIFWKIK